MARPEAPGLRNAIKESFFLAQHGPIVDRLVEGDNLSRLLLGKAVLVLMADGGSAQARLVFNDDAQKLKAQAAGAKLEQGLVGAQGGGNEITRRGLLFPRSSKKTMAAWAGSVTSPTRRKADFLRNILGSQEDQWATLSLELPDQRSGVLVLARDGRGDSLSRVSLARQIKMALLGAIGGGLVGAGLVDIRNAGLGREGDGLGREPIIRRMIEAAINNQRLELRRDELLLLGISLNVGLVAGALTPEGVLGVLNPSGCNAGLGLAEGSSETPATETTEPVTTPTPDETVTPVPSEIAESDELWGISADYASSIDVSLGEQVLANMVSQGILSGDNTVYVSPGAEENQVVVTVDQANLDSFMSYIVTTDSKGKILELSPFYIPLQMSRDFSGALDITYSHGDGYSVVITTEEQQVRYALETYPLLRGMVWRRNGQLIKVSNGVEEGYAIELDLQASDLEERQVIDFITILRSNPEEISSYTELETEKKGLWRVETLNSGGELELILVNTVNRYSDEENSEAYRVSGGGGEQIQIEQTSVVYNEAEGYWQEVVEASFDPTAPSEETRRLDHTIELEDKQVGVGVYVDPGFPLKAQVYNTGPYGQESDPRLVAAIESILSGEEPRQAWSIDIETGEPVQRSTGGMGTLNFVLTSQLELIEERINQGTQEQDGLEQATVGVGSRYTDVNGELNMNTLAENGMGISHIFSDDEGNWYVVTCVDPNRFSEGDEARTIEWSYALENIFDDPGTVDDSYRNFVLRHFDGGSHLLMSAMVDINE